MKIAGSPKTRNVVDAENQSPATRTRARLNALIKPLIIKHTLITKPDLFKPTNLSVQKTIRTYMPKKSIDPKKESLILSHIVPEGRYSFMLGTPKAPQRELPKEVITTPVAPLLITQKAPKAIHPRGKDLPYPHAAIAKFKATHSKPKI